MTTDEKLRRAVEALRWIGALCGPDGVVVEDRSVLDDALRSIGRNPANYGTKMGWIDGPLLAAASKAAREALDDVDDPIEGVVAAARELAATGDDSAGTGTAFYALVEAVERLDRAERC